MDPTRSDPAAGTVETEARPLPTLFAAWTPDPRFVGTRRTFGVGEALTIGRERDGLAPGLADDPLTSRQHVRLEGLRDGLRVVELRSRNGTRVDGRPLVGEAVLGDGGVLAFGDQVWVLRTCPSEPYADPDSTWIGVGPAAAALHARIALLAPHPGPVLVLGEPGSGKELVARELHRQSGRRGALLAADCTSLPDTLLHAELFGHTRGAFTGADRERPGLVRAAEGGTLLLDEIGDASPALQGSLLRLLEAREIRPVGTDRPVPVTVRVVAATHRDPAVLRPDLLGRLHWQIRVPPLRERPEDVGVLVRALAGRRGRVPRAALEHLLVAPWPGNVRELAGVVEELLLTGALPAAVPPPAAAERVALPDADGLRDALRSAGSPTALARRLGVGRSTVYRWLRAAGIPTSG